MYAFKEFKFYIAIALKKKKNVFQETDISEIENRIQTNVHIF